MKRIGEILVDNGWVSQAVLDRAVAKQREIPRRLCSLLIAGGAIDVDQASRALGEQLGVAAVLQKHLDHRDRSLADLIPAELARAWWVLPIGRLGNGDLIVCARDPRPAMLVALQAVLGDPIVLAVAPASHVETLVAETYGVPEEDFDVDLTTGPIASLELEPMADEDDPMGGLSNLELVELDDQGVARDPTQSGMLQVGPQQRGASLPPSSAGIRIPATLPPVNAPHTEPAPRPTTTPPATPPRPELVVIDPPTRPPVKRAPTEPAIIVDTPPSQATLAEDAARVPSKSPAEQAAELAKQLPAEPQGGARLLARPETAAASPPVVIRPRRQSKPPLPTPPVDDGWDSPDVDARPPATTTVPPPVAPTRNLPEVAVPADGIIRTTPSTPLPALDRRPAPPTPLPRVIVPADDAASIPAATPPLKKPPPVHAVSRPPTTPPATPAQPPTARHPVMNADDSARSAPKSAVVHSEHHADASRPPTPTRAPTQPPTRRIDPDVIAAAYAIPPPAYDPNEIAVGTVRPQRKALSLPTNLPDTLTALGAVTTPAAATAAAMRFAQGRWRAALLLQVKEKSALGEAGHGNLLGEDVVAGLAIPLAARSIVAAALEARALTTVVPPDDSPVQDRLDRLLGMPRFPAAAPILVGGYPAFVLVIGDPIADDTDAATSDLERVAAALAAAYARVTAG